jgi:hypothetical protein
LGNGREILAAGTDEAQSSTYSLKDMARDREQKHLPLAGLVEQVRQALQSSG